MTRTPSIVVATFAFFAVVTLAGAVDAQPRPAASPVQVERSSAGDFHVAVDVGVGLLYVDETAYNSDSQRYESVPLWSSAGGAADLYAGWVVAGIEGSSKALSIELGYRLSTLFDDTAVVHAHEFTAVFRVGALFASAGAGVAAVTIWNEPGVDAPRFSFSGQFGYDLIGRFHIAFDTGVMMGPDDHNAIERMTALLGYTF